MYSTTNTSPTGHFALPSLSQSDFQLLASEESLFLYSAWLHSKGFSSGTIKTYYSWVKKFLTRCLTLSHLDGISPRTEQMYRLTVKFKEFLTTETGHSPQAINNAISAINSYCRYLRIDLPAIKREVRKHIEYSVLSEEEVETLLTVLQSTQIEIRDRAIFLLFLVAGISLKNCCELNEQDLRTDDAASLVVLEYGPRRQRQILRLHKQSLLGQALLQWSNERIDTLDEDALFLSVNGQRLSSSSMHVVVRKTGWKSRLPLSIKLLRDTGIYFNRLGIELR